MSEIRPREGKILELLYHFPYMTDKQIVNLLDAKGIYKRGSSTAISTKLLMFIKERYLLRNTPLGDIQGGSVPFVYWLATIGRNYLTDELGYDFSDWRVPSEMAPFVKSSHFAHCLRVNDVLIAAVGLSKLHPAIKIDKVIHDFTLHRDMQGSPLVPDGLIRFGSGDAPVLWIEIDNATEKETEFRSKLRRIVEFMDYGWSTWFETPAESFTFVFVTKEREHRNELVQWCQKQLIEMHKKHLGSVFYFADLPKDYNSSIFIDPIWSIPFSNKNYSLLEL